MRILFTLNYVGIGEPGLKCAFHIIRFRISLGIYMHFIHGEASLVKNL